MMKAEQVGHECGQSKPATSSLDDLLPIAVVIAAGCESCAERAVQSALRQGCAKPSIERTLRIVAHLRARDCFVEAVGPEVVARMEKPLLTGQRTLRGADPSAEGRGCCG